MITSFSIAARGLGLAARVCYGAAMVLRRYQARWSRRPVQSRARLAISADLMEATGLAAAA